MRAHPTHGLLPTRNWERLEVDDLGDPDFNCEWCGTLIRYIHTIKHKDVFKKLKVGSKCVLSLCGEEIYKDALEKEDKLKKRSAKLKTWMKSPKWYYTDSGNLYRKDDRVLIFMKDEGYRLKIKDSFGRKIYPSIEAAKLTAFKFIYQS